MSEDILVQNAAPTLAGLKSGNLFSCTYENRSELESEIRHYNSVLAPKGVVLLTLRWSEKRALIYVFRPHMLRTDLEDLQAAQLLRENGYEDLKISHCLRHLRDRLNHAEEFPHEIGLFLSYPPEDVRGFMEHREIGCKAVGTWRVYGDAEAAETQFRKFKKCTDSYQKSLANGIPLERLAVAV